MAANVTVHERVLTLLDCLADDLEGLVYDPGVGSGSSSLLDIGGGHVDSLRRIVEAHRSIGGRRDPTSPSLRELAPAWVLPEPTEP